MNKRFLLLLLTVGAAATAQAQLRVGAKVGGSLTRAYGDNVAGIKNRLGVHAGVMLHVALDADDFFAIQPEILYSQKGYKAESGALKGRSRLHYVDVPILGRINADGFIFEAGPQLGYLAGVKNEQDSPLYGKESSTDLKGYNRFAFGYVAGVGYQLSNGVHVGLRYNGHVNSLLETLPNGQTPQAHNAAFQVFVGCLFKD
ncbi:PorT family protein [Hymenobacter sp. 15J16-1T3B]|uniref:porin family protein n=1 Tax=Hymenobacter sp. 15J16-1T3B TaxID=2886941 RepID=UPI001D119304|nr:porin family protein [Hymenobacter sp. 15J16-1T3B]MCC3155610.1 PorT family protein [Hymenobacter sp. 15J16-1T3B]